MVHRVIDFRFIADQITTASGPRYSTRSVSRQPPDLCSLRKCLDGASRYASNGFFDAYDCAPWDLWLQYSDRTLISWVPEILFPIQLNLLTDSEPFVLRFLPR